MRNDDVNLTDGSEDSLVPAERRSDERSPDPRHTRTSGAWGSIALGLTALVVVLVFAVQNLTRVEMTFLSLHWSPPLAVLLLLASALGGLVVFAFGAARIGQLRVQARRMRRRAAATQI